MENRKIKILEPNKGKHIAVAGDINKFLHSRKTQVERIALSKLRFFLVDGRFHTFKHVNTKGLYIIEGQIIFYVDEQRIEAKPGTFVNIPPNVLHSFKNETYEIAKLIIVLSPAGMDQLFVEVGLEISNNNVMPPPFNNEQKQKLASLASKYGMEIRPQH
jgi:mannose-6-phosphate isomerase-like protein (cupin superfamily)